MQTIIKHNQVIEDHWTLLDADAELAQALSTAQPIVTLALWQAHKSELQALAQLGIWLKRVKRLKISAKIWRILMWSL